MHVLLTLLLLLYCVVRTGSHHTNSRHTFDDRTYTSSYTANNVRQSYADARVTSRCVPCALLSRQDTRGAVRGGQSSSYRQGSRRGLSRRRTLGTMALPSVAYTPTRRGTTSPTWPQILAYVARLERARSGSVQAHLLTRMKMCQRRYRLSVTRRELLFSKS